tara:strand:+ start:545 stop:1216 length:672 start_codon:yes stop_codon:yes gene_type:complete
VQPITGAVLVFERGSGGHVGFAIGQDDTNFYVLGGNQSDAVTVARIAKSLLLDVINGDTPIPRRQEIVNRFQRHLTHDGGFDMLILGPKAAGTGLTLTAATNVIHLSRWWNPAVEEQCNDRVHRIGQTKPVEVHLPLAIHPGYAVQSFDCLLQSQMQRKRRLASRALWPMGDTKGDLSDLQADLAARQKSHSDNILADSMTELFQRDALPPTKPDRYGAYKMA